MADGRLAHASLAAELASRDSEQVGRTMLPPFDDVGNLPPGIHNCSVAELVARFGSGSEEREAEISELVQFIEAARTAGVRRLLVNGSFATGKLAPNDVDVVFLPGPD